MLGGVLTLVLVRHLRACRALGLITLVALLTLNLAFIITAPTHGKHGIYVSQMGDWLAPYGISLVYDPMSALLLLSTSVVMLAGYIFARHGIEPARERRYFHPMFLLMTMGVNLSFLTGDVFNLFVAFEVMLMASYGLLVIGSDAAQVRHAYKYILLNLLASTTFVIAAGMAYGMLGTLNMADMARVAQDLVASDEGLPAGYTALGVLFFMVYAMKAAVFPLWAWLPDTYPTMPVSILAVFGGVLTKVGVYAIARLFPTVFAVGESAGMLIAIMTTVAVMTMIMGGVGALAYRSLRRVLCMLLISGVGYALLGVAVGTPGSLGGSAFYMAQSMVTVCAGFLLIGLIERHCGSDDIEKLGGLYARLPWLTVAWFVMGLSLAGLPPLPGFLGKFVLIREAVSSEMPWTAIAAVLAGGVGLLAVLRVFAAAYWLPSASPTTRDMQTFSVASAFDADALKGIDLLASQSAGPAFSMRVAAMGLTLVVLAMGVGAQWLLPGAMRGGEVIIDGKDYHDAVYSAVPPGPTTTKTSAPATTHEASH